MAEFKDWFVPAASGAAALLGVFNVFLNNRSAQDIERLKTQIVRIGEERKFASDIMTRFDNVVVDAKSDRATRISRLEGLMALAGLMTREPDEEGGLNTQGILAVIKAQADGYKGEIAELSRTATGAQADQLQAQYARVDSIGNSAAAALGKLTKAEAPSLVGALTGSAPAAAPAPAPSLLDATRVDIFWCAGMDQSAEGLSIANALYAKRPATSQQPWRVRSLDVEKNARVGYQATGLVIRAEQTEAKVATELAKLAGSQFRTWLLPGGSPTPGYVSVFICPT